MEMLFLDRSLDKFIAATGGREKYQSIKSEMVEAEISFASENLKFPVVSYSEGNKYYSSSELPSMGKMESGDDGVTGWEKSVVMGPKLRRHSYTSAFMGPDPAQVLRWSEGALEMETISQDKVNRIDTTLAYHAVAIEVKEAAINQPLPPGIFDLPPDVRALKAKQDALNARSK